MGKRKSKDPEYYKKKIRKLTNKLKEIQENDEEPEHHEEVSTPHASTPEPTAPVVADLADDDHIALATTEDDQLPQEFLLALGNEGAENEETGKPIRAELALRWTKIMTEGLGKEGRLNLIKKYPTPTNFTQAVAPILNPEIVASLSEQSLKRDKKIVTRQNLIGILMTALGNSLTNMLRGNINSNSLIEEVNDPAKLAAEIYFQDSAVRKFFALSGANKIVQDAVRTTKTDAFLFGTDCGDKIKAAQAIQRTSSQIKNPDASKKLPKESNKQTLNWRGPSHQSQQQNARGGHHFQHQSTSFRTRHQTNKPQRRQVDRKHIPSKIRPQFNR